MELNEIKEIIEIDGGKFIIVENGKPVLVIMGFAEYKGKLKKSNPLTASERIPEEIPSQPLKGLAEEEVNVEDLPLE